MGPTDADPGPQLVFDDLARYRWASMDPHLATYFSFDADANAVHVTFQEADSARILWSGWLRDVPQREIVEDTPPSLR